MQSSKLSGKWLVCVSIIAYLAYAPNTLCGQADKTGAPVSYRARLPIAARFAAIEDREITVLRRFPDSIVSVEKVQVHIRLASIENSGTVTVLLGNAQQNINVQPGDWIARAAFDDHRNIEQSQSPDGSFPITIQLSPGLKLGRLEFDSSPNIAWAANGQDGTHFLDCISYEVWFQTDDPELRAAGFLELPELPRVRPAPTIDSRSSELAKNSPNLGRTSISLNGLWQLTSSPASQIPSDFSTEIVVPGLWTSAKNPQSLNPDIHSVWYQKEFVLPKGGIDEQSRWLVHFQQASFKTTVYLNGTKVGSHIGDLEPFEFDVTDHIRKDQPNELLVCVEDHNAYFVTGRIRSLLETWRIGAPDEDLPMFAMKGASGYAYVAIPGSLTGETDEKSTLVMLEDGVPLGPSHSTLKEVESLGMGRYFHTRYGAGGTDRRVVYFSASDNSDPRTNGKRYDYLADVPVPPLVTQRLELLYPSEKLSNWTGLLKDVELRIVPRACIDDVFVQTSVRRKEITVEYSLGGEFSKDQTVRHEVWKGGEKVLSLPAVMLGDQTEFSISAAWPNPRLWKIGDPYLYFLKSELRDSDGKVLDVRWTRFGFREFWVEGTQFVLNGRPIRLQGDSPSIYHYVVPREHRWFESLRFQVNRYLNHNFSRLHVGGMNSPEFLNAADEMGMLIELEPPYLPYALVWDYEKDAPNVEKFKIVKEQYRQWARRFRNHPSLVMYSLENEWWAHPVPDEKEVEHFKRQLAHLFKPLNDTVAAEDPTRPINLHGARGAYDQADTSWLPIVNLHYFVPASDWKQKYKRPIIIGEFSSQSVWSHLPFIAMETAKENGWKAGADRYWSEVKSIRKTLSGQIDELQSRDIPGIMPYALWRWFSPLPLNDARLADGEKTVEIDFPSVSGSGQKPAVARIYRDLDMHNWFDPSFPKITQTPITDVMIDHFDPQPFPSFDGRPEVLIEVCKAGNPVPGAIAFVSPREHQASEAVGVMADNQGKAWFVLPEAGEYDAWIASDGEMFHTVVQPERVKEFGVVKTIIVEVP